MISARGSVTNGIQENIKKKTADKVDWMTSEHL